MVELCVSHATLKPIPGDTVRYARRRDLNENDIVLAAERIGFKVLRINEGADLVVSYGRLWRLWEVKGPDGKPTPAQIKLRERGLKPEIIRTVDDVLEQRRQMAEELLKLAR